MRSLVLQDGNGRRCRPRAQLVGSWLLAYLSSLPSTASGRAFPRQRRADTAAAPAIAAATQEPRPFPMLVPPLPVLGSFTGGQLPLGQSHTPSKQVRPFLQTLPQAPQLLLSQQVATQAPLQFTSPSAQQSPLGQSQIPSKQLVPDGQALPQAPQWLLLQQVSTQIPSHSA
jgi:hypothetical protein